MKNKVLMVKEEVKNYKIEVELRQESLPPSDNKTKLLYGITFTGKLVEILLPQCLSVHFNL